MTRPLIRVIQGPNLNYLGSREREHYGELSLEAIHQNMTEKATALGLSLVFFQSNHEGALIDMVQLSIQDTQGLIINPAGFTHTSVALADAMALYPHPAIEVHLSNIYAREEFRRHSYVSPHVSGTLCGLGARGYLLALEALAEKLLATECTR